MNNDLLKNTLPKRSILEWIKRLIILFLGLVIAHLGVTLFVLSELGSDTFTIFIQGLSETVGISIGTCHVIILCLLMLIMIFTTKGYIKPGTFICAFCGGPIIDFFIWLLGSKINGNSPMLIRLIIMIMGCIILSLGMSIVIKSDAGTGPNDLIAIILTDKIKRIQFRWVRISCDLFFTIIGFLLGGTLGIGTIVAAFLTGPTVQFFLPKSDYIIKKIV